MFREIGFGSSGWIGHGVASGPGSVHDPIHLPSGTGIRPRDGDVVDQLSDDRVGGDTVDSALKFRRIL